TGPVFGERISLFSKKDAKRVLAKYRGLRYPCHWRDTGVNWSADTIPKLRLGDEDFAYLKRKPGSFSYNYEYLVRRGRVVLLFALNAGQPDRALADSLVRTAMRRYNRRQVA